MKKKQKKRIFFSRQLFLQKNCRGIVAEYLPWLILGLVALGVVMIILFALKGQGISLIDKIKALFRF